MIARCVASVVVRILAVWFASVCVLAHGASAASRLQGLPNISAEYPRTTLHEYILGPVCLSLPSSKLELSCNPAFLAYEDKHQFRLDIAGNDHLAQVNAYRERLNANDSVGIANAALGDREPTLARASSVLWYQRDWWALSFAPFRGGFASSTRNAAYPEVAADIYKEYEILGKAGLVAEDSNLSAGLQLRYVDRQYFRRQFDLLDAIGDPSLLKIEQKRVLYVEPGINYMFESNWSSSVAATVTQLPLAQDGNEREVKPVVDIGLSTAPPIFGERRLRTSTHYTGDGTSDVMARFRWGALFDLSKNAAMSALIGKSEVGVGLNGHIDSLVLGLGWKTEELTLDQWQTVRVSTVLFETGLMF